MESFQLKNELQWRSDMAIREKPYDLDCWVEFVEKGQWFMVWEENWIPLFTWRPGFILLWPQERLSEACWQAAVNADPALAERCPFEITPMEPSGADEGEEDSDADDARSACPPPEGSVWWHGTLIRPADVKKWRWKESRNPKQRLGYLELFPDDPDFDWTEVERWMRVENISPRVVEAWNSLLRVQPQFADRCGCFSLLGGGVLAELLAARPEFAERPDIAWQTLSEWDWRTIVSAQPGLIGHLKSEGDDAPEMYRKVWGYLLPKHPEFLDQCDLSLMDESSVSSMLDAHPLLVEKLPGDITTGSAWRIALMEDAKYAAKCRWDKLSVFDWDILLKAHPEYFEHFIPDEYTRWGELSEKGIDIDASCPVEDLNGGQVAELLRHRPDLAPRCDLSRLATSDWSSLLSAQPQFAGECDLTALRGEDWAELLGEQPCFADKCEWRLLDGDDWEHLLKCQPQFADRCDWDKIGVRNWLRLMVLQPELGEHCTCWGEFDEWDWRAVAKYHGDHLWRCPAHLRRTVDRRDWFWGAADAWHEKQLESNACKIPREMPSNE